MSRRLDEGSIPAAHGHLEDAESTSADPATRLEEYQYTPLKNNQIRILRLEPSDFGSPLSATFLYTRVSSLYPEPDTINGSSSSSAKMIKHRLEHLKPTLSAVRARIPGLKHRYEAISYAWGPPDQPYHIIMHKHYRLPLTESLYSALQRFRYRRESRNLWADAVCINQLDLAEKSAQVAIMGSIYGLARRVLVWLGDNENEDSEKLGCSLMRFVAERTEHSPDLHIEEVAQQFGSRQPTCGSIRDKLSSTDEPPSTFTEAGFGVRLILESPWFTRLWTIQEIDVARDVCFQRGTHSFAISILRGFVSWHIDQYNAWLDNQDVSFGLDMIPRSLIVSATASTQRLQYTLDGVITKVYPHQRSPYRSDVLYYPYQSDMLLALYSYQEKKCSSPLDRIYAIRNVTRHPWRDFKPDYNLEPVELAIQIVAKHLERDGSGDSARSTGVANCGAIILALAGSTETRHTLASGRHWPSWVLDFRQPTVLWRSLMKRYEAAPLGAHFQQSVYGLTASFGASDALADTLTVGGRAFAYIAEIVANSGFPDLTVELLRSGGVSLRTAFEHWLSRSRNDCAKLEDIFSGCPTLPLSDTNDNPTPWDYIGLAFQLLREPITGPLRARHLDMLRDSKKLVFFGGFIGAGRPLAVIRINSRSYLGFVPPATQVGDSVCMFYGAPFPFVIRERPAGGTYELLGDSYFSGLTDADGIGPDTEKTSLIILD